MSLFIHCSLVLTRKLTDMADQNLKAAEFLDSECTNEDHMFAYYYISSSSHIVAMYLAVKLNILSHDICRP